MKTELEMLHNSIDNLSFENNYGRVKSKIADIRDWLEWSLKKKKITKHDYNQLVLRLDSFELNNTVSEEKKVTELHSRMPFFLYAIITFLIIVTFFNSYFLYLNTKVLPDKSSQTRVLPFKGSIEEVSGTPLDSKRDVFFRLYSERNGGSALYTGSCVGENGLQPQFNGTFTILIGSDCGIKPIPGMIFEENDVLYLGVTIGKSEELQPRYQILTDSVLDNSSSLLQGKSVGTGKSSIPYLNDSGQLVLDADSPIIKSTDGIFSIQGQSLKLETLDQAEGDIVIKPGSQSNTIIEEGRVGIGDMNPDYFLSIENSQPLTGIASIRNLSLLDEEDTSILQLGLGTDQEGSRASFIEFFAGATASEKGEKVGGIRLNNKGVAYESSGADFAEYFNITYISEERDPALLQPGMIVSIGEKGIGVGIVGEQVIGAISENAGFIGNVKESGNGHLVALIGQVPVWTSNIHGELKKGDRVGVSRIPGFAAKVEASESSVGYVLQSEDEVAMSNTACPQRYRKLKDNEGKRVKCGKYRVLINLD